MSKDVKKKEKNNRYRTEENNTREETGEKKEDKENIDLSGNGEKKETEIPEGDDAVKDPSGNGDESEGAPEANDAKDDKIAELNDRNLRLMAEFENFRKRSDREKEQMFENGAKSVIEKVLPVIDNFERALNMTPLEDRENKENDPFMEGMQKVYRQLMDELLKIGVKPIEAVGKEFDPEFHNAVMQVDSEEYDSGIVASEMQKGYLYNDSVVRHSMVGVAK